MIWATVSSQSCFWLLCIASIFVCKEYNQSDFGVDYLVMSMCSLLLCCWKRCFPWPVRSLGKTLLAFDLLCFALQGQICLLLQVCISWLPTFAFQSLIMKSTSFSLWNCKMKTEMVVTYIYNVYSAYLYHICVYVYACKVYKTI